MFKRRSHILAPLTELTGHTNKKFVWRQEHQKAFDAAEALIATETLMRYPDHNKPFHIYTDASDLQLGAVIQQDNHPVAFYSRKLNAAQRNYTTMEKELLSVVETLREFRTTLLGCKELHVHTDHKNLTFKTLNSECVLRWRLFIEEYNPIFHYVPGQDNAVADALSRLPISERQECSTPASARSSSANKSWQTTMYSECATESFMIDEDMATDKKFDHISTLITDENELFDCFMNHPGIPAHEPTVLDFQSMQTAQQQDAALQTLNAEDPQHFPCIAMANNVELICCVRDPNNSNACWKICLPDNMVQATCLWYHRVLGHIGAKRLKTTMQQHLHHPDLGQHCERIATSCEHCQENKQLGRGYGELPPRNAPLAPWQEIAVDCIGPWTIEVNGQEITFNALTIIDQVTNFPEIIRLYNKTAAHAGTQLYNSWLSRYPRPVKCIFDQGSEFIEQGFQQVQQNHRIKPVPTSVKNPQANSVCERLHQSVGNVLRILLHANPPQNVADAGHLIDTALQTAAYAMRTAINQSLQISPGNLVFQRDMILNIPIIADIYAIHANRQALIDQRLIEANRKRIFHDYQPNEQAYKVVYKPNKLGQRLIGPYPIVRSHINGTVTLNLGNGVTERINIRRIRPFRQ